MRKRYVVALTLFSAAPSSAQAVASMTTAATMMAAVPSALGLGAGADTRGPMAIGVPGGLTLSTVLNLLVVPSFYLVADRIERRLAGKKASTVLPQSAEHASR
jgi:multidrug efflux pump subunit AcrB